jgi:hypothetical protein
MIGTGLVSIAMAMLASSAAQSASTEAPISDERRGAMQRLLNGLEPAEVEGCINRNRIRDVTIISDDRILYRYGRNLIYENRPSPSCEGMARDPREPAVAHGRSLLCSGDVLEVGTRGSFCTLGRFTAWRPVERMPPADGL